MEPAPGGKESPPEARPPITPDRKQWAVIGTIVVFVVIVAIVLLPGLLGEPQQGVDHPISGTPLATTIVRHWTPGTPIPSVPGNETPSPTPTWSGPPGFTVSITPVETSAARGETVVYHMTIEAQNGFSENISMKIVAGFLFFSQTQDLGNQEPPYPKTIEYPFQVPETLVPGATINGVLTSTGGGITRENQLVLHVR